MGFIMKAHPGPEIQLAQGVAAEITRAGAARACCCFLGLCTGGGLLSMGDLLGAAITAGAGMFCALFLEMAVYVTALRGQGSLFQDDLMHALSTSFTIEQSSSVMSASVSVVPLIFSKLQGLLSRPPHEFTCASADPPCC